MATVRCPCGRSYAIADERLGQKVQCAACKRTFVAADTAQRARPPKAPPRAAPAARLKLGELAVARGLLTREQLDACLRHLERVRKLPGHEDLRLGSVLVSKRLITAAQLHTLLGEQNRGALAAAAAAIDLTPRSAPVTDEQRAALRRSVEAATKQESQRREAEALLKPGLLDRVHMRHFTIPAAVLLAVAIGVALWPAPASERVLRAYLESCDEANVAPDATLAVTDLGLAIREYRILKRLPSQTYDYGEALTNFPADEVDHWFTLLETSSLPTASYNTLLLLAPAIPEEFSPRKIGGLRITVQPILCRLVFRQRGMAMYSEGQYRFTLLKAASPTWRCDWKVAACDPAPD